MNITDTTLPPLAPKSAPMKSREEFIAEHRARVAHRASRPVPAHILGRADRLCFDSRSLQVKEVTEQTLVQLAMEAGPALSQFEHLLAHLCNLRGTPFRYEAGRNLRKLCGQLHEVLHCIEDQTHAAEEESETARTKEFSAPV